MHGLALIDGVACDPECLDQRAFQFGDGLFETVAIRQGAACLWKRHLDRLDAGCARLGLPHPDPEILTREVRQLAGEVPCGVLKLYWWAGTSSQGYRRPAPIQASRALRVVPLTDAGPVHAWRLRLCAHRLGENPALAGIKHLNRLDQVLARAEWDNDAIDEGIMLGQDGRVVCGTMSNVFVQQGEHLFTPRIAGAGIAGVVRGLVIWKAKGGPGEVIETDLDLQGLRRADALYLCNSIRGIVRVGAFEDKTYDLETAEHPAVVAARPLVFSAEEVA